jgi:hypothetical protein
VLQGRKAQIQANVQSLPVPQDCQVRLQLVIQRLKAEKVNSDLVELSSTPSAANSSVSAKAGANVKAEEFRLPPPAIEMKQATLYSYTSAGEISEQLRNVIVNYDMLLVHFPYIFRKTARMP